MIVLDSPDEIGMTRAGARDHLLGGWRTWLGRHNLLPVFPVLIRNLQRDGIAEGQTFANTGEEFHPVLLDPHTTPPAIALLSPGEVMVDVSCRQRKAGGNSFEDGHEAFAMGFTAGEIAQHREPS